MAEPETKEGATTPTEAVEDFKAKAVDLEQKLKETQRAWQKDQERYRSFEDGKKQLGELSTRVDSLFDSLSSQVGIIAEALAQREDEEPADEDGVRPQPKRRSAVAEELRKSREQQEQQSKARKAQNEAEGTLSKAVADYVAEAGVEDDEGIKAIMDSSGSVMEKWPKVSARIATMLKEVRKGATEKPAKPTREELEAETSQSAAVSSPTLEALLAKPVHKMTRRELEEHQKALDAQLGRG